MTEAGWKYRLDYPLPTPPVPPSSSQMTRWLLASETEGGRKFHAAIWSTRLSSLLPTINSAVSIPGLNVILFHFRESRSQPPKSGKV